MAQLYANFCQGVTTDNPLGAGATSINAASFALLPVVASPNTMWITLDPDGIFGAPEIVSVTTHTVLALVITVARAQQGTVARIHPLGTQWRQSETASDFTNADARATLLEARDGEDMVTNGNFDVWQRGSSFVGSAYTFCADRWQMVRAGFAAGFTVSKIFNPFSTIGMGRNVYVARLQRDAGNAGTGTCYLNQNIEALNSIQAAGQNVTLSFYAYAGANWSAGGNFRALIRSGTGNDQNDLSAGFTGGVTVATSSFTITTGVQRFTVTGTVPANSGELAVRFEFDPTGTAGAADYVEITGVKLEVGTVATPVKIRQYADVLHRCVRFFQRWLTTSANNTFVIGQAFNGTQVIFVIPYPGGMMRGSPGFSVSAVGQFSIQNPGAAGQVCTGLSQQNATNFSTYVIGTVGAGMVAGSAAALLNNTSGAYIDLNAEI